MFAALALAVACLLATGGAASAVEPTLESGGTGAIADPALSGLPTELALRRASPASEAGGPALAGPVDPRTYLLGPGDVMRLQFWGRLTRSETAIVGPEGFLALEGLGTVRVSGRTLAAVRDDVLNRLRPRYRGVEIDLRLARPRTFQVQVTGEVKSPGPMTVVGAQTLGDVLLAEAFTESASLRRIEVRHADGMVELADLERLRRSGDSRNDPMLRDGDIVHVPVKVEFVWIQGAVARPGRYEYGANDSLGTLLALGGGALPSAQRGRLLLVRFHDPRAADSTWVPLAEIQSGALDMPVRNGDRVYVYFEPGYHVQHEALILGEVARPGVYPIDEGFTRLGMLLDRAGGFLPSADLSSIRVHRLSLGGADKDPEFERLLRLSRGELTAKEYELLRTRLAGQREDYRIDWRRVESDANLDLLLRDQDAIRVERLVSSVRIDGEVERPGILNYVKDRRAEDYVGQAGGFTTRAWRSRVLVTRAVTGQTVPANKAGTIAPGDLIWVPDRPDFSLWDRSRDLLSAVGAVATIVIAIRTVR